MVAGRPEPEANVARNLLADLEEVRDEDSAGAVDLTEEVDEVASTPATKMVNTMPLVFEYSDGPARAMEALMTKHAALKNIKVERIAEGAGTDVQDPGFAAMTSTTDMLKAIVRVLETAGYRVKVTNRTVILSHGLAKLASAGQAVYDLLLRHQMRRKIEAAYAEGKAQLKDEMDESDELLKQLREEVMMKNSMLEGLEKFLEKMAADKDAEVAAAVSAAASAEAAARKIVVKPDPAAAPRDAKPSVKFEAKTEPKAKSTTKGDTYSSSDYLADIYDDCMKQTPTTGAATRLRQSAVGELKSFDGKVRAGTRGKDWLSGVRAAFRRDQLSPGESLLNFPDLLSSSAKNWYRQLPKAIRADWSALQAEFEEEYCGTAITAQHKYFYATRRTNEEAVDYLYRLNVLAKDAGLDYDKGSNRRAHVRHFITTCDDQELARQLTGLRLADEKALRDTLRDLYLVNEQSHRDEITKARAAKREAAKETKSVKPIQKSKSTPVHSVVPRTKAVRFSFAGDSSSDSDDLSESLSDEEVSDGEEDADSDLAVTAGVQGDAAELLAKVYAMLQGKPPPGRPRSPTAEPDRRRQEPCTHCGSRSHRDLNCWRRLTCQACGRTGHPTDQCYQRCRGCGKVHERGECPLEELATSMKAWYDPSKHAGMLPPSVEKWLN